MSKKRNLVLRFAAICMVALLAGCSSTPQEKEAKYIKRGEALLFKKDYQRATLEFRNAANVAPRDAEPYYQLGLAYLGTGSYGNAASSFQKALTMNPGHPGAQLKLASMMATSAKKDTIEDAEKRLHSVLAANPDNVEALDALAATEAKLGKQEDETKLLDLAIEKFPKDLRAAIMLARLKLSQNDPAGAEEVLKKVAAAAPKSSNAALMLGRVYLQQHKDSQAEAEIRRALELDAKSAPALLSLAVLQAQGKRLAEAEQTYKRLAALPDRDYNPNYGLFLLRQGRQDAAVAEFQRLAKVDPDDRNARALLLGTYVLLDRTAQAEGVLAEALKRHPKDIDALMLRARFRMRSHNTAGAEEDLQQVLRYSPDSAAAHFEFAKLKDMEGRTLVARQELSQSLSLDPKYLAARLALAWNFVSTNEAKSALELLDQTPPAQKDNPWVLIQRNWALLSVGNLKEARQGIDQGLKLARVPDLLEQDGFLKMKEGNFAGARADAEELLKRYPEQDPANLRAVRLLVDSCVAQHQVPQAVQELRELASQRPKSAQLQTLLGRVLVSFGNRTEGRAAYEAAQAADPKYMPVKIELAQIDLAENRLDPARQTLETVVASDPRNVTALLMLAQTEAALGHRPAAMAKYRAVLTLDESNAVALKDLASLINDDNPDEALRFAEKAVEMAPDDASAQDTLGWVYYRKGIYGSAAEHLKVAVAKEPTPRRQYHLAMSYLKAGDRDRGEQLLATALKQDPKLATEKAQ